MHDLWRLRLRLTVWYVGVFAVVLAAFGGALFAALTRQISRQMDRSLLRTADAAVGVVEAASFRGDAPFAELVKELGARDALRPAGRMLYIFDDSGTLVAPDSARAWIRDLGTAARAGATVVREHEFPDEVRWRALARPFALVGRGTSVVVVRADVFELEDQYAGLLFAFLLSAVVALALIGAGVWLVAGRSLVPVRDSFRRMRNFMADAAHELRTPVTVIEGNAEVALRADREPGDYREFLATIHAEASRLGGVLENLLTIARADAGAWPIRSEPIFLDDLLLEVSQNVRVLGQRKGVRLEVVSFDALPVHGDPDLPRQLLMILLDNALKYGRVDGRIDVAARREEKWAALVVEDDGPGIPPDALPHVFDRFYRGDPASGREAGAGLGLSIAAWIAEVHHAKIAIDSRAERGTRVTVRFPLEEESGS